MQKHVEACSVVWVRKGAYGQVGMWLKVSTPLRCGPGAMLRAVEKSRICGVFRRAMSRKVGMVGSRYSRVSRRRRIGKRQVRVRLRERRQAVGSWELVAGRLAVGGRQVGRRNGGGGANRRPQLCCWNAQQEGDQNRLSLALGDVSFGSCADVQVCKTHARQELNKTASRGRRAGGMVCRMVDDIGCIVIGRLVDLVDGVNC